ncbi:13985_t:CDS:1, partial [Gigaspora rosea]
VSHLENQKFTFEKTFDYSGAIKKTLKLAVTNKRKTTEPQRDTGLSVIKIGFLITRWDT